MLNLDEIQETNERLKAYPELLEKIKGMLDLIEKKQPQTADDFEEALIPQVRNLGQNIVQAWASKEKEIAKEDLKEEKASCHSKKNSTGIRPLEK